MKRNLIWWAYQIVAAAVIAGAVYTFLLFASAVLS